MSQTETVARVKRQCTTKEDGASVLPGLEIASLAPAYKEIERMIAYFREDMSFRDIRITPVIQTQGRRRSCGGYFTYDKIWENKDGVRSHEIQISSEHLSRPAMDIAVTIRHELVHASNCENGIVDTSNSGTYHNKRFLKGANAFGLEVEPKTATNGHGITKGFTAVYEAIVAQELQPNDDAFTLARETVAAKTKTKGKMKKWSCGCTTIRAAVEVVAVCQKCNTSFDLKV
jgi:hypothetical protein